MVLQGVEYGAQLLVARGFERLERGGDAGELGESARKPRALLDGQHAPGEQAEEARVGIVRSVFQGVLEQVAEELSLRQGDQELYRRVLGFSQRVFST